MKIFLLFIFGKFFPKTLYYSTWYLSNFGAILEIYRQYAKHSIKNCGKP